MNKAFAVTVTIILIVFITISCSKDGSAGGGGGSMLDCSTVTNKAFAADVNPIIQSRCNVPGCHSAGSTNGPGPLTNHAQVAAAASSVRSAVASGRMPQGGALTTAQKNSLLCWIDSGAPNN